MTTLSILISVFTFSLLSLTVQSDNENGGHDICTKYGVLHHLESFFPSQTVEKEISLDLAEFRDVFEKLATTIPQFKEMLDQFDTVEELERLEPDPLIPFIEDFNLIKVESLANVDFAATCSKKNASLIAIEPESLPLLVSILKAKNVAKTPVLALAIPNKIVSLTGKLIHALTSAQFSAYETNRQSVTLMLSADDSIAFEDTPTAATTILCIKRNNPFDLPNSLRTLWLKTTSRIQSTLPTILKWGGLMSRFMYDPPASSSQTPPTPTSDLAIAPPAALNQILSFVTKFSFKNSWLNLTPSGIGSFLGYCENFKGLLNTFSSINSPLASIQPYLERWSKSRPSVKRFPSTLLLNLDPSRILKYLSLASNFRTTGLVSIRPLLTGDNWQKGPRGSFIRTLLTVQVYNIDAPAHLFQIKPVFYNRQMTDMKYLIKWSDKAITFTNRPALLKCTSHHPSDIDTPDLKICHGFQQPGQTQADVSQRTACANLFLNEIGDYSNCLPSPSSPSSSTGRSGQAIAVRASCANFDNSVALVSSNLPSIKVVVRCSVRKFKVLELHLFPTFLETSCPIYWVRSVNDEVLLLPDNLPEHLIGEGRSLDFLIKEPLAPIAPVDNPPLDVTTTRKSRTQFLTTTTPSSYDLDFGSDFYSDGFSLTEFFQDPANVSYIVAAVVVLLLTLLLIPLFILLCKYTSCSKLNCCNCSKSCFKSFFKICKRSHNESSNNSSCCPRRKHKPTTKVYDSEFESDIELETVTPAKATAKAGSSKKYKLHSLNESELEELSNLMQERLQLKNKAVSKKDRTNLTPTAPALPAANNSDYTLMPSKSNLSVAATSNRSSATAVPSAASSMGNISIRSAPSNSNRRTKQLVSHTFRHE